MTVTPGTDRRAARDTTITIAVTAVAFLCLAALALTRLIDSDEGYYLLAARLVTAGRLPYIDFFYPQMFLTPYVYGAWSAVAGSTWYAGRILSALMATALVVLVFRTALRAQRRRDLALLAALLFLFSELSLAWLTVVKTYALSALLLFAAFAVTRRAELPRRDLFLLGVLLGLAVDTRLYIVGVVPLFFAHLWRRRAAETGKRAAAPCLLGLALALLPNLALLATAPHAFLFDNLGYHGLRSAGGLIGEPAQKLAVLLHLLGGDGTADGVRLAAVFVPSLLYSLVVVVRRGAASFSAALELALAVLLLLPTPTFTQYFSLVLPFAVVNTVALIGAARERFIGESHRAARAWGGGLALAAALYLTVLPGLVARYAVTGERVIGILTTALVPEWQIATVRRVSRAMARAAPHGGLALVWWPGYLVESRLAPLPGTENHFGRPVAALLPADEAHRLHLASEEELLRAIDREVPDVVVLGNDLLGLARLQAWNHLRHSSYRLVTSIEGCQVWARWREGGDDGGARSRLHGGGTGPGG